MQGSCADLLEAVQEHIEFPIPDEEGLREKLGGFKDAGEITGEPDLIFYAMMLKHSMCLLQLEHITPDIMATLSCEDFISGGQEMGWVNPEPENFKELYGIGEDLWAAGGETFNRCEGEVMDAVYGEGYGDGLAQVEVGGWCWTYSNCI